MRNRLSLTLLVSIAVLAGAQQVTFDVDVREFRLPPGQSFGYPVPALGAPTPDGRLWLGYHTAERAATMVLLDENLDEVTRFAIDDVIIAGIAVPSEDQVAVLTVTEDPDAWIPESIGMPIVVSFRLYSSQGDLRISREIYGNEGQDNADTDGWGIYWFEGHGWGGPSQFPAGIPQAVDHFEWDGRYFHAYFGSIGNFASGGVEDMHQGDTYLTLDAQGRVITRDDFTMSHSSDQAMALGEQGVAYTFAVNDAQQYLIGHRYTVAGDMRRSLFWPPDSMVRIPRGLDGWDFSNSAGVLWDVQRVGEEFFAIVGTTETLPDDYAMKDMVMLRMNEEMEVLESFWITDTPEVSEYSGFFERWGEGFLAIFHRGTDSFLDYDGPATLMELDRRGRILRQQQDTPYLIDPRGDSFQYPNGDVGWVHVGNQAGSLSLYRVRAASAPPALAPASIDAAAIELRVSRVKGRFLLEWSPVDGATHYEIYSRSPARDFHGNARRPRFTLEEAMPQSAQFMVIARVPGNTSEQAPRSQFVGLDER